MLYLELVLLGCDVLLSRTCVGCDVVSCLELV